MNRNAFRKMLVVGVDDGSFNREISKHTLLSVVLCRGLKIEEIKLTSITVDGLDATQRLIEALGKWQFSLVLLAGISFAGFNIIDPTIVYARTACPVIVVSRRRPNNIAVKHALRRHFKDWKMRFQVFEKMGHIIPVAISEIAPPLYAEIVGTNMLWAIEALRALSCCSRIPEPLRVARLIAKGASK